jgi:3-phenylpropionate/trans-cinnamate dioxygenase ferredoxin subunit
MGEFMTIGPATVGEGDVAGFDIEGAKIGVARVGGSLYAFSAVCTHQGCPLAEMGELDGKELECECHGSVFDVTTGAVIEGPATIPLEVYPTREVDGNVEIEV